MNKDKVENNNKGKMISKDNFKFNFNKFRRKKSKIIIKNKKKYCNKNKMRL